MEHIFPHIRKPLRYIGNELGSIHKDWHKVKARFAICYPDLYELGMSNLGIRILYHLLNSQDDVVCERVFAPWIDFEAELRKNKLPLISLESQTPLNKFDCIGFSLQYELTYTNVLNILDLGGIPLHTEERGESDPLIVGGGSGALNPAPLQRFFDCFVIGEAEPIISKLTHLVKEWRLKKLQRKELLKELSHIEGIYVPGINDKAKNLWVEELRDEDFPSSPILPFIEIERDALMIEIARGCTRGCRFCQAGMVRRPYRERDVISILKLVQNGIQKTGYRTASLLSLSASDHSQLLEIVKRTKALNVEVSLPSLRGDALTHELASLIGKGGITIAPETGTDRLRKIINKEIREDQILNSCELASSYPFTHTKLYYMVGLPGETQEDITGIISLTNKIAKIMRGKQVNVALSPFVPRPHTPFQWEAQEKTENIKQKINCIKGALKKGNIKIKYRHPEIAFIEGVCARGDESLSRAIEEAWHLGAKFDGWSEHFNLQTWEKAFQKTKIDPYEYLKERKENLPLPWNQIDVGIKKEYLLAERHKSDSTLDCRIIGCTDCGVCEVPDPVPMERKTLEVGVVAYGRSKKKVISTGGAKLTFRVKFEKTEPLRFLGHLDMVRAITRAMRRVNIPIAYSKGFHPRPKLSFSPPLPFGVTSREEYFDLYLEAPPKDDIEPLLNKTFPEGLQVLEVTSIWSSIRPLFEMYKNCEYEIMNVKVTQAKIAEFIAKDTVLIHDLNIRPFVLDIKTQDNNLLLTMRIGKAKPWWILEALLDISEDEALDFKIERTKLL